jgi:glycosyltransferase involved in cell wall biosynthesis
MHETPLVSIIMNCFNGEKYLRDALDSVMKQTYQNWELIFWDNQSTDKSAEILKSYADQRIKYYYAPKKTLLYEARNYALKNALGEFVAFLDVDDWWSANKLERQLPLFKDPLVGIVYGKYNIHDSILKRNRMPYFCYFPLATGYITNELLKSYVVGLLTLVVRLKAIKDVSFFNNNYHIIGDFDLSINISLKWKFACVQEPIAFYRSHNNSESQQNKPLFVQELSTWYNNNYNSLCKFNHIDNVKLLIYQETSLHYFNNNKYRFLRELFMKLKEPLVFIKIIIYILLNNNSIKKVKWATVEQLSKFNILHDISQR